MNKRAVFCQSGKKAPVLRSVSHCRLTSIRTKTSSMAQQRQTSKGKKERENERSKGKKRKGKGKKQGGKNKGKGKEARGKKKGKKQNSGRKLPNCLLFVEVFVVVC